MMLRAGDAPDPVLALLAEMRDLQREDVALRRKAVELQERALRRFGAQLVVGGVLLASVVGLLVWIVRRWL